MKKFATLVLFALISLAAYPQKEIFSLLENQDFYSLENPDSIINTDPWTGYIHVYFGPGFEKFKSKSFELGPAAASLKVNADDVNLSFMDNWSLPDDSAGPGMWSENSRVLLKYSELNAVRYVECQIENVSLYQFPDQLFTYKYRIYEDGVFQIWYGPNSFDETMWSYKDKVFTYRKNWLMSIRQYLLVTEDFEQPILYDTSDDYDEYKDRLKPFPHPPTNFAFQLNLFGATTGLDEVNLADIEMEIKDAILNMTLPNVKPVVLEILDMQGRSLLSKEHHSNIIEQDLNFLSKGAYVIRLLKNDDQVFVEKVQL